MNSHHSPDHPRYCSPERFHALRSPRRTRPARPTGKRGISFAPPPAPRSLVIHRASVARRNAFLDLNAATERNSRYNRSRELATALGKELNPARKPEDMELWTNRYRLSVVAQKAAKANVKRA